MTRQPDPQRRLFRALVADADGRGVAIRMTAVRERPWSSATFVGCRLTIELAIAGGDVRGWLAALPDADLPLPGRFVADLVVARATDATAMLEVLVLET